MLISLVFGRTTLPQYSQNQSQSRVRVTLQLTVSQSVCPGVEPNLELLTRDLFFSFKVTVLSLFWDALSDERSGLSFVSFCQCSLHFPFRTIWCPSTYPLPHVTTRNCRVAYLGKHGLCGGVLESRRGLLVSVHGLRARVQGGAGSCSRSLVVVARGRTAARAARQVQEW
jgi:hypothetical protein